MRRLVVTLFCVLLATATLCLAQGQYGTISGRVTDPSGSMVPGATVKAVNEATGLTAETVSNEVGLYVLANLPPGRYTVNVTQSGFKNVERAGLELQVSDRLTVDFAMQLGQATETINVTAETPQLRVDDPETGEVINQQMIFTLPQVGDRDPFRLMVLAGNVQGGGGRMGDTRINGGRTQGLDYFVDGIGATTGLGRGVTGNTPTMESVQEFKVITNGLSAEYGRISGGGVELVTKSGTNEIHGQLFEYMRNRVFNANSWNQNRLGQDKPLFQWNNFGVAVGGPVVIPKLYNGRNKTFWFFNYDGTRYNEAGVAQTRSVPTEAMRNGDFSGVVVNGVRARMYDPRGELAFNSAVGEWERLTLFPNNGTLIPADRISPVSKALLQYLPLPNRAPDSNCSFCNNYIGTTSTKSSSNRYDARIDQVLTDNQRLFGRFVSRGWDDGGTRWWGPLERVNTREVSGAVSMTLNYDWTISPTLLLNARIGGNHDPWTEGGINGEEITSLAEFGFDPVTANLLSPNNVPWVRIASPPNADVTGNGSYSVHNNTSYNAVVSMTKILGAHVIKFGYDHRRFYDNFYAGPSSDIVFQANPVIQYAKDEGWGDQASANVYGAYLLGINDKYDITGWNTRAMNFNYHGAYIQDDWKLTPRLTLNLGVRWDMETPVTERSDKLYFWDPEAPSPFTIKPGYNWNAALEAAGVDPSKVRTPEWVTSGKFPNGAIRIANTPEWPDRYGTKYHWNFFSPRIGAAWQISDKTVLRAHVGQNRFSSTGYAGAFASGGTGVALGDAGYAGWHANDGTGFRNLTSTWENPFKPSDVISYQKDTAVANFQATGGDPAPIVYNREMHMPYEWTWNFGFQHELPWRVVAEAAYNGNMGRDLLAGDLISRFPKSEYTPDKRGTYLQNVESPVAEKIRYPNTPLLGFLEYPYPYYGPVQLLGSNIGKSQYHALNLRAEKRMSSGLALLANYTLSRMKDNTGGPNAANFGIGAGGEGARPYQSVDTVRDVYGISVQDETHRVAFHYNYQLPVGRGRTWLGSPQGIGGKILDHIVGGWELSGLSTWRSGRPVVIGGKNVDNILRIEQVWSRLAPGYEGVEGGDLNFEDLFYSVDQTRPNQSPSRYWHVPDPVTGKTPCDLNPNGPGNGSFNPCAVLPAKEFTYGNLSVIPGVRNPGRQDHSASIMKNFNFTERVYLQFRGEVENMFNMRGWPDINTDTDSADFGLLVMSGDVRVPRRIQFSARIVF